MALRLATMHVDNVVQANLAACVAPGVAGRAFNIAAGNRITLMELLTTLEDILGVKATPTFSSARIGDVPHSYAAIDVARTLLGYEPTMGFREGLELTVTSMKDRRS